MAATILDGNRIAAESEDDRDRFDVFPNNANGRSRRNDDRDPFTHQLIDETWQTLRNALGRSRDQDDIPAFDKADLGKTGDPGGNVFQATIGSNANISAGICLQVDGSSGTLSAEGNMFSGGKNCATTAASLTWNATSCGGNRDLGMAVAKAGGNTMGNDIDVLQCTHP